MLHNRFSIILYTLLFSSFFALAQTPVANRVKAVIKSLPKDTRIVAKYTDNNRHSLYYILQNRLYRYDVVSNKNEDVNFENEGYSRILNTFLSPDDNFIFIIVDRGPLIDSYLDDSQVLWRIDSRTKKILRIESGFKIEKKDSCYKIQKLYRRLKSKSGSHQQKWTARKHYFDLYGKVIFASDEYPIRIKAN